MNESIPVTIAAKNEERSLGSCLDSIFESALHAKRSTGMSFDVRVIADDCTDRTEDVARSRGVTVLRSTGGKVEAQRKAVRSGPFAIFVDADVVVSTPTLDALATVMRDEPSVFVVTPKKLPLPPIAKSRLAHALYVYNRERGFSSQRTWFSGKCFAIRKLEFPTRADVAARAAALPDDRFYCFGDGVRADDVYLSRRIVHELGPAALRETDAGCVYYRAPETIRGMYRYYRRMRMELERISALFPELDAAYAKYGRRSSDQLAGARPADRVAYVNFAAAFWCCRVAYRVERRYYQSLTKRSCPAWPSIEETKCSLATDTHA